MKAAKIPILLLGCSVLLGATISLPANAAEPGFAKELTKNLRNFERQLCQKLPSSKCVKPKKRRGATSSGAAKPSAASAHNQAEKAAAPQPAKVVEKEKDQKSAARQVPVPILKSPRVIASVAAQSEARRQAASESTNIKQNNDLKAEAKAASQADSKTKNSKASPEQEVASAPRKPPKPLTNEAGAGECLAALQASGASFAPATVDSNANGCFVSNPVKVSSVATSFGTVKLPDQPILACRFAVEFAKWITANGNLEKSRHIDVVWTGPGYQCRGRNGDISAKLSAHAFGRAIDIEKFRLSDGSTIVVADALKPASPAFVPLQKLRASACNSFTTVLGPGANAAHESHFHFDLEQRKSGYRICQ